MLWICSRCSKEFFYSKKRSVCLGCCPAPIPVSKEILLSEYNDGSSYRKLARRYGVAMRVVEAYVNNFGSPRHKNVRSLGALSHKDMLAASMDGSLRSYEPSRRSALLVVS